MCLGHEKYPLNTDGVVNCSTSLPLSFCLRGSNMNESKIVLNDQCASVKGWNDIHVRNIPWIWKENIPSRGDVRDDFESSLLS